MNQKTAALLTCITTLSTLAISAYGRGDVVGARAVIVVMIAIMIVTLWRPSLPEQTTL